MTLLITVLAAATTQLIWYASERARKLKIGVLCYMFWGASLMWLVDAIFEYAELGADYFTPAAGDMLNDLFLGLSVIALALVVWVIVVMIKDPDGTIKKKIKGSR